MVSGVRYPFAATNDGQVEAIEDARRGGAYTCLGCGAEGTRSAVVIDRGEKPPLIVEVVVSHDPEPATLDRY